ncbi:MAG: hypothetical protein F6K10_05755 [Moorea sp. SIO2B7]|nr:hypothetical protein [Moorena sp. SIO2B7]
MSSPPTSPYKSRLFNFLNRQFLHLNDRLGRSVRHLKVAAEWGVQIMIYPVYALVQTGRMAARQFKQKVEHTQLPQSTAETKQKQEAPTTAQAIERVLKSVEPWLSQFPSLISNQESFILESLAKAHDNSIIQPDTTIQNSIDQSSNKQQLKGASIIRGVATCLETRNLVLVTTDNQIVNLLTPIQQQKLQQRIIWEIANYRREKRLAQIAAKPDGRFLPIIQGSSPKVLLPVRLFWQVMSWMQTSPIAITINLFGESKLTTPLTAHLPENSDLIASELTFTGIFTPLDDRIANLETNQSEIVHSLSERLSGLGKQLQERLKPSEELETSKSFSFQIQSLIYAAIDYFFGKHSQQVQIKDNDTEVVIPPDQQWDADSLPDCENYSLPTTNIETPQILANPEEDPWDTEIDLDNNNTSIAKSTQKLQKKSSDALNLTQKPTESLKSSKTSSFKIQALIWAAIDHFFGKHNKQVQVKDNDWEAFIPSDRRQGEANRLPGHNTASLANTDLPDPQLLKASVADPWNTEGDLGIDSGSAPILVPTSKQHPTKANTFEKLQNKPTEGLKKSTASVETAKPEPYRIQALIWAAIDYFFGKNRQKFPSKSNNSPAGVLPNQQQKTPHLSGSDNPSLTTKVEKKLEQQLSSSLQTDQLTSSQQQLPNTPEEDPWLSSNDLFGDSKPTKLINRESRWHNPSPTTELPRAPQTPAKPGNYYPERIKRYLKKQKTPKSLQSKQAAPTELSKHQNHPSSLSEYSLIADEISQSQPEDTTLEPSPDWVETEAQPVGYVKHPLERILEWLDQIMLWVEEIILRLWRWLRKK